MFGMRQLKQSDLHTSELVCLFRTRVRPITEYACPVYHDSLPVYPSILLEQVQRRALRIIYPYSSYEEALIKAGLVSLAEAGNCLLTGFLIRSHAIKAVNFIAFYHL